MPGSHPSRFQKEIQPPVDQEVQNHHLQLKEGNTVHLYFRRLNSLQVNIPALVEPALKENPTTTSHSRPPAGRLLISAHTSTEPSSSDTMIAVSLSETLAAGVRGKRFNGILSYQFGIQKQGTELY